MTKQDKTGQFVVRISPDMHARLAAVADKQHRSLNSQVVHIFETYFDIDLLRQRLDALERAHME
jgi:predicted HicB family RNase H-like nuclease